MRRTILLMTAFLGWASYDPRLIRGRQDPSAVTSIEISLEERDKERKRRRALRRNENVVPAWHRDGRKSGTSKCNYFSTKPRDVRFSNQRKIRRMFNNT